MIKKTNIAVMAGLCFLVSQPLFAGVNKDINSLKKEVKTIQRVYEKRISELEDRLNSDQIISENAQSYNSSRKIYGNKFNPSIGVILNGQYNNFSAAESEIAGFAIGEEGDRGSNGFSIGESELNFSSNIDDKFFGSLTAAIVNEDGAKIELEEAFISTRPELGLPTGMQLKFGRAFWKLGYLNEKHSHSDDFSDRPLPYRVFLNKSFNDDGAQLSYILPTDFYFEIGGGAFRGEDFPYGGGEENSNHSLYFRTGGDITQNQNWRIGGYVLSGEAKQRIVGEEASEEIAFLGESDLYIADLRYNFAPTGNAKNQEITLQGEYFYRQERGAYNDANISSGDIDVDNDSSGFYFQSVYKFSPQYRVGLRYSKLQGADVPSSLDDSILNAADHDPVSYSAMIDWTNSEFSRIRLQYSKEELSKDNIDNQITLQYIVSLGAHSAHSY